MYLTGRVVAAEQEAGCTKVMLLLEGEEKADLIHKKDVEYIGVWLDDGRTISALQRKKIYKMSS